MIKFDNEKLLTTYNVFTTIIVGFLSFCFITCAQGMENDNNSLDPAKQKAIISSVETSDELFSITDLIDECLLNIFRFLSPEQLVKISEVDTRFYKISYDNFLWKEKVFIPMSYQVEDSPSYRDIFKDLYLNPILFQYYNDSHSIINFRIGYKYTSNTSLSEAMLDLVQLNQGELVNFRKNDFPEDRRNDIVSSHCSFVLMPPQRIAVPDSNGGLKFVHQQPLSRSNFAQALSKGACLVITKVQESGFTMIDFNTISPLR